MWVFYYIAKIRIKFFLIYKKFEFFYVHCEYYYKMLHLHIENDFIFTTCNVNYIGYYCIENYATSWLKPMIFIKYFC